MVAAMAAAAKVRRIANCILTKLDMSAGDGQMYYNGR